MRVRLLPLVPLVAIALLGGQAASRAQPAAASAVQLRVDQAGYLPNESKQAILMTSAPARGTSFDVTRDGQVVLAGAVDAGDRGAWNSTYRHSYVVDLSGLDRPGTYRVVVHSSPAASATVRVTTPVSLYRSVLLDGVHFYTVQRDGSDVVAGALHRKPSHLHDAAADVYATPTFDPDTDEIIGTGLTRIGGPVDVSGGWFDAGDYLKFTHTAAFADLILQVAQRDLARGGTAPAALVGEAQFGLDWLSKMWHPETKTLDLQVGTGNGTSDGKLYGDHDLWRLPQRDDANRDPADVYAAAYRPVFLAAPPGHKISPNLAGRVAAAFALAAQNDAVRAPATAAAEYRSAVELLDLADTASPPDPLTTALPNDFYPESTWRDDMELGSAEVALAARRLHRPYLHWVTEATTWAKRYLADEQGDTFNLYDTSALAHTDLVRAMRAAGPHAAFHVTTQQLLGDLARQLDGAAAHASDDPFHASGDVDNFDIDAHTFGIVATAGWYHQLTGSRRFDTLAADEKHWLFGTNAWGVSFMVGVGQTYPHCMQHQVANLSGSLNGSAPIALGAVVNGPNGKGNFDGGLGGFQDGMRHCALTGYTAFDGHGSRYVDDVRSWQTDEPALDMTGAAIAAAAAQLTR